MSKLPSRGPRVMHGMGKLMAMARNLVPAGPAQAKVMGVHPNGLMPAQDDLTEHAARMADLAVLVQRCTVAERRVARVQQVTDAFAQQVSTLPADHWMRIQVEQVLATYREAIK